MTLLPPLLSLLLMTGMVASFGWIAAEVARRASVRGSRPRYVWASVERALRYPALVYFSISAAIESVFYKDWLLFATACAGVALWMVLWHEKKRDGDDDDFWTSLKKRIQAHLTSTAVAPSVA